MSVGFPQDKSHIDSKAGALVFNLRNVLTDIQRFKTYLDATPDVTLQGFGYSAGEVATLKSAFADLDKLRQIANAGATQSTALDFFTFAKQLLGVE
jgi:hypothetical protein